MCGITAYIGSESAFEYIIASLILLQNRGYDSAGICTINENTDFVNHKYASTIEKTAIQILQPYLSEQSSNTVGIGHTRWATHGAKTDTNAHPHLDNNREFSVVHNGIIENYLELKNKLTKVGIKFSSQTDTEVVPNLLAYYLSIELKRVKGDYANIDFENNVLKKAVADLEGTWALVILFKHTPNKLYLCKNGSPLVMGIDDNFALISSEQLPLSIYFTNYITLNDGDIVTVIKSDDGKIKFPNRTNYIENIIQNKVTEISSYPYPHWTIKEICEQPMSILRTLNMGGRLLGEDQVKLGGLDTHKNKLIDCEHIIILGCGTSYNAGQIGCKILRSLQCVNTVQCIDASEFTIDDIPNTGKTVFVLLSQSGETKDLHRCIESIRNRDCPIIAIVNVVGSLIARESDCGIYLNAGREVGVASTKSFTSQVVALTLMSIWFSQNKNTCSHLRQQYVKDIRNLSLNVEHLLASCMEPVRTLAKQIKDTKQMFILGRGFMKFVSDEASLKIKEIGYIHAEGYAGGSLKHGPFALIDNQTVIILIAPRDENFSKMINAAEEVKSRHARVVLITNQSSKNDLKQGLFETVITIPCNDMFQSVLSIIPLQLLSYEIALLKGHNPDFPKNLAKVVTVDG
jgi:glucosamine--fructose-6-phosphate aminotransferase (isomerizing)